MNSADYTAIYDPDVDFDARYTLATAARIVPHLGAGEHVLEAGAATGLMTAELVAAGARVTAIDRSVGYLERLHARGLPGVVTACRDLDADALPAGPFDHVVATNLLHELDDPAAFLRRAAAVLRPGGHVHVSVPNPTSLHRLVALEMGLLADLHELSARAEGLSTRRMLDHETLAAHARDAGLAVEDRTGVLCKPLPNALMEQLPAAVLDGLDAVSHRVPDLCAMTLMRLRRA